MARDKYIFERNNLKEKVIKASQEFCEMLDRLDKDLPPSLFFSQEDFQGFHVNIDAGFDPLKEALPFGLYTLKKDQPVVGITGTVICSGTKCQLVDSDPKSGLGIIALDNGMKIWISLSNLEKY